MKTFVELQDEVLESMGDSDDQGSLRTIVKTRLQRAHQKLLTGSQWDFMLWPLQEQISVVVDQKVYNLHPEFFQPLYFYDTTEKEFLEVVPVKQTVEVGEDVGSSGLVSYPQRVQINTISNVAAQPAAAGVVTVTTTGGTESASNSVVIRGIVNSEVREETLSSATSWSTLTGSLSFSHIIGITKVGATWSRTIDVTVGATTILSLLSDQWGKQYQQVEFFQFPQATNTIYYRFYRRPRPLSRDNDVTDCPQEFDELLVIDAKLNMTGYSKLDGNETQQLKEDRKELWEQLVQTYTQSRALNSRARYVTLIPRT